jgi:hypothetical protein
VELLISEIKVQIEIVGIKATDFEKIQNKIKVKVIKSFSIIS